MIDAIFLRELAVNVKEYELEINKLRIRIPPSYNEEMKEILQDAIKQAARGRRYIPFNCLIYEAETIAELVRLGFKLGRTRIPNRYKISW